MTGANMELGTAFLLGLVGSLHCAGMCGPLALALPVTGGGFLSSLAGRVFYNLGRVVTYCALGLVFGLVGQTIALAGFQRWVSIVAGSILLLGLLFSRRLPLAGPINTLVYRLKNRMGGLLRTRSLGALGLLGLLTGLLPCGLVYVACAGAAATANLASAVQFMACFGLGTFPLMLALSMSGKLVPMPVRSKLVKAVPVAVFVLSILLILRGLSLGIPYVSPDLSKPRHLGHTTSHASPSTHTAPAPCPCSAR